MRWPATHVLNARLIDVCVFTQFAIPTKDRSSASWLQIGFSFLALTRTLMPCPSYSQTLGRPARWPFAAVSAAVLLGWAPRMAPWRILRFSTLQSSGLIKLVTSLWLDPFRMAMQTHARHKWDSVTGTICSRQCDAAELPLLLQLQWYRIQSMNERSATACAAVNVGWDNYLFREDSHRDLSRPISSCMSQWRQWTGHCRRAWAICDDIPPGQAPDRLQSSVGQ